jgi:hypothetical protein
VQRIRRPRGWEEPGDGGSWDPEDREHQPIYTIRWSDGSEHPNGDGLFGIRHVPVPAQQTVSWYGNAGHPEGIKQGAPIGSCVPEVMDVRH